VLINSHKKNIYSRIIELNLDQFIYKYNEKSTI